MKWRRVVSSIAGICGIAYAVVFVVFNLMTLEEQMPIITSLFLTYVFCEFPLARPKRKKVLIEIFDIVLAALALAIGWYHVVNTEEFIFVRMAMPNLPDIIMGTISIALVLESVRRVAGWVLVILACTFLFYAFFGYLFPSLIVHRGYGIDRIVTAVYVTKGGLYGLPTQVVTQYVILFISMGAFLEISGGSQFLVDLARAIAGRLSGGPGMVSIVSSSLFGTVSGSVVANVVVDGVITIPAMKKYGFEPHVAGAIEAYTSTGGQLVPPIMGAAAFLMADALGISYVKVVMAAILPAFLYYFACFAAIFFYARGAGLRGQRGEDLPSISRVARRAYYLTPILLIIAMLTWGYSPTMAGFSGLLSSIGLCFINRWLSSQFDPKFILKDVIKGAANAARETSILFPICTVAGVVIGIISLTGVGPRLSYVLITITSNNLFFLLCLVAVTALIMGMGMPTTALYILLSVTLVPALMELHLNALASHFFIFYFGLLGCLTPPVAIAAYAAAPIAEAEFNKVGWAAFKLAVPSFIIPFAFIYQPALLLGSGSSLVNAIWPLISGIIGVFFVTSGIAGYFIKQLPNWERIGMILGGIMLLVPHTFTDLFGGLLILICLLADIRYLIHRRKGAFEHTEIEPVQ